MRRSYWRRLRSLRTAMLKYLSCSRRLTPGWGGGKRRSARNRGRRHCERRSSRSERLADQIQGDTGILRKLSGELLFRGYFTIGLLENLGQNAAAHLLWLLDAVNVQDRRSHVVHAGSQAHQAQIMLDSGAHSEE